MLFKLCDEASDSDSESSNDYSDDETEFFDNYLAIQEVPNHSAASKNLFE